MTAPTPYLHLPSASPRAARSSTTCRSGGGAPSDGQVVDRYGLHWLIGFED